MSIFSVLAASALAVISAAFPLGKNSFNDSWQFSLNGGEPRTVTLPHDWGVEGAFVKEFPGETGKLEWWGKGEYTKELVIGREELSSGNRYYLDIEGAMSDSKVFCNGSEAGGWPYGYSSYRTDLTPFLKEGSNMIKVTLDNPQESSRWYPGGGLYRNVWLCVTPPVHTDWCGVAVETVLLSPSTASLQVRTTLRNTLDRPCSGKLVTTIVPWDPATGKPFDSAGMKGRKDYSVVTTELGDITDGSCISQTAVIPSPELWSPDHPFLYTVHTRLQVYAADGETVEYEQTSHLETGIRTVIFKPDGLYVNGVRTFMKGVCLHHDAGALGAVWSNAAWERRLALLKDMGCNAIRTSHNPPAPELLDLCDRMGFLVIDELTDTWTMPKKPNGYALLFDEWAEKDLTALILRDRNHPSVILWSIGNEVGEQGDPGKYSIAYRLSEICHSLDPSRKTTSASDNAWASTQDWRNTVDVYGFNYKPHLYGPFHEANPQKPYYGSETASCVSTRGFYLFPVVDEKDAGFDSFQVSSYDLYAPAWASKPDVEWDCENANPGCAGEFVWTGFDYLGEPTPYNTRLKDRAEVPSRSSYFGILDLAGFPKDRFYLYQSRWRPDVPVAHILPHWNWPGREGQVTPVHVYTNGSKGELFVNGKSQGVRTKGLFDHRMVWEDVVYEPGTVEVVTWKNGKEWARSSVTTSGKPSRIVLNRVKTPSSDHVFIEVKLVDKKGNFVPTACNDLRIKVRGAASFVAADSGDPTSHIAFSSQELPAFNGLSSIILRPEKKGRVVVRVYGDSLKTGRLVFKVRKSSGKGKLEI